MNTDFWYGTNKFDWEIHGWGFQNNEYQVSLVWTTYNAHRETDDLTVCIRGKWGL